MNIFHSKRKKSFKQRYYQAFQAPKPERIKKLSNRKLVFDVIVPQRYFIGSAFVIVLLLIFLSAVLRMKHLIRFNNENQKNSGVDKDD